MLKIYKIKDITLPIIGIRGQKIASITLNSNIDMVTMHNTYEILILLRTFEKIFMEI